MQIFLSSTAFDLLDVRAEIAATLQSLGVKPVLSDDKLSDFRVHHDADSIETCLVNLEACDEVILVLDQRYGPSLGGAGFDDVSATHLEFRKAVELKKPVHFFARDRLIGEYAVWKKNKRSSSLQFAWVSKPEDFGLFRLLDERSKLIAKSRVSNWYTPFTNSIDLKAAIAKTLEPRTLPLQLVEAIQGNRFPILDVENSVTKEIFGNRPTIAFRSKVINVGGSPAFNVTVRWENDKKTLTKRVLMPGQSISMQCFYAQVVENIEQAVMLADYESAGKISVSDIFTLKGGALNSVILSGAELSDRKFFRSDGVLLEVLDKK